MKRRLIFLLFFGLFFIVQGQVTAAGPYWRVWIHEVAGRHLTMVEDTGTVLQEITLPLPDLSYSTVSRNVGISHNGNLIAYFLTNTSGNIVFELYDVAAMTMYSGLYTPPVTTYGRTSLDIIGGSRVFSVDDRYLALAVQVDSYWEIVVLDTTTRTIVAALTSSDAIVTDPSMRDGYGLPAIQEVRNNQLHFSYIEGMEGQPRTRSFVWNWASTSLTETNRYPQVGADLFEPTGEVLAAYQNESYPNQLALIEGIPIQFNVVQVSDAAGNPPFIWFNNEGSSLSATFVENGQRVLVMGYNVLSGFRNWALIERDLTILHSDVPPWETYSATGVGDGFIYLATNVLASGEPVLMHHNTTAGTLSNLASVWTGPAGTYLEIAWVSDIRSSEALPESFLPWAGFPILGEPPLPTATGSSLVPATSAPLPTSSAPLGIAVGVRARIVTTEGDMLNVRSGAGRGFALVYQFANDTRVTILEGPISADGFNWWRVRADDGREGWVVDFADGVATLVRE